MKLTIRTNPEIVIEIEQEKIEATGEIVAPIAPAREPEPERKPQTKKTSAKKQWSRQPKLDADALKQVKDKIRDMIPFSEISRDHDVTVSYLYGLKHRMRRDGETSRRCNMNKPIPKSVSKYMSKISKRRHANKLREHLKRISSMGVKARQNKAKKAA
jgi:hypothetical protein